MSLVMYPYYLVSFWYKDAPLGILNYYIFLNKYLLTLLSIPLMVRTFFEPLKNEYRKGLVFFSICFGVMMKTFLITISSLIFILVLAFEIVFFLGFVLYPFILVFLWLK